MFFLKVLMLVFLFLCVSVCVCWCYLDRLIRGSREEQVSSGVDTQTPNRSLVANKCPLTLEDLLRVVCYTEAQRRVRLDMYFSLETKRRSITEAETGGLKRDREVDEERRKKETDKCWWRKVSARRKEWPEKPVRARFCISNQQNFKRIYLFKELNN